METSSTCHMHHRVDGQPYIRTQIALGEKTSSMYMPKSIGDSTRPCFTPLFVGK